MGNEWGNAGLFAAAITNRALAEGATNAARHNANYARELEQKAIEIRSELEAERKLVSAILNEVASGAIRMSDRANKDLRDAYRKKIHKATHDELMKTYTGPGGLDIKSL